MSEQAQAFLEAWTVDRGGHPPLNDADAGMIAEQWESDARDNGIAASDLREAAGGDVAAFLQRTFGREGSELDLD